jgi:hypothetical protein
MTTAAQGDPSPPPLLGPVLGTLPAHLFHTEVLRRLGPRALASLAGAGRGCAAAVAATALMQWAKLAKLAPLAQLGYRLPPLCLESACSHAASGGNREVLEWLHNTGCPWSVVTTCAAARGGHREVLEWLHNNGCPWDAKTCASAARSGHLRVLQWMREQHCPWNSLTPAYAAAGGLLRVLQWAREHGCPWNSLTCMYAASNGQLGVLQWVRANDATGETWDKNTARTYATGPKKQEVLAWLNGLNAP